MWLVGKKLGSNLSKNLFGTYNIFNFINSPSILVTTAPEAHWAQVLSDLDLGSKKMTHPH